MKYWIFGLLPLLLFAACDRHSRRSGAPLETPEPFVSGVWEGTLTLNGEASSFRMTLSQTNITVNGTFDAPAPCPGAGCAASKGEVVFGDNGRVDGVTSGFGLTLTLTASDPLCAATHTLSGFNDGSTFSFNTNGVDCDGNAVSGQGSAAHL